MQESPIFIKSYETMIWILEHTKNFPKDQRFVMAKRIEEAILTFYDEIVYASRIRKNTKKLFEADYHLERLRIYNRMCKDLRLLSFKQYEYLAKELCEIGNLLGGWIKNSTIVDGGQRD